ncbi:MAG: diphthine--ammonia ligase [Bacteroidia bacterium]
MSKAVFNWSGGKDSALALYHALSDKNISIEYLLTSLSEQYRRVSMHGVKEELLEEQAKQIGLPLRKIYLPENADMKSYNSIMRNELFELKSKGITQSIFGDIFLEDLKRYREEKLAEVNMIGYFPLWQKNTKDLVREFIDLGFKTIIVCVNGDVLDKSFAGRIIDKEFIKDLPKNVDPCGENGEFHTFVFDGPIFKHPVFFTKGEVVERKYPRPKNSDDNCFNAKPPSNEISFYFQELK